MGKKKISENCCLKKEKWIRFKVVKFANKKYGVVDNHNGELLSVLGLPIHRDNADAILDVGQMSLDKARKLCKDMNKKYDAIQYQEIK